MEEELLVLRNQVARLSTGRTDGATIEAWMISWKQVRAFRKHITHEPPPECRDWVGPHGQRCGQCRYWEYVHPPKDGTVRNDPDEYPTFRLILPGYPNPVEVRAGRIQIALTRGVMKSTLHAGHVCPCGEQKRCMAQDHLEPQTWLQNRLYQLRRLILEQDPGKAQRLLALSILASIEKAATKTETLTEAELQFVDLHRAGAFEITPDGRIIDHTANGFDETLFESGRYGKVIAFPRLPREALKHQVCPIHYDGEGNRGQFGKCLICQEAERQSRANNT